MGSSMSEMKDSEDKDANNAGQLQPLITTQPFEMVALNIMGPF
jgi:hypothetical protein